MKTAILCYVTLLGIAASENCQTDSRTETVQYCIRQCPFPILERAMNNEENGLKVWTAFHHPRKALPVFLVVKYSGNVFSDHEFYKKNETYLWTSNSIYFAIPPHVFGFISLFVGILDEDHTGEVHLILPLLCSCWLNGSMYFIDNDCSVMNYLEILTEKVSMPVDCMECMNPVYLDTESANAYHYHNTPSSAPPPLHLCCNMYPLRG